MIYFRKKRYKRDVDSLFFPYEMPLKISDRLIAQNYNLINCILQTIGHLGFRP